MSINGRPVSPPRTNRKTTLLNGVPVIRAVNPYKNLVEAYYENVQMEKDLKSSEVKMEGLNKPGYVAPITQTQTPTKQSLVVRPSKQNS